MVKRLAKVLKNGAKCQNPKAGRTHCNLRETVTCTDILRGTPPGPSSSCQQVSWLAGRCVFLPSRGISQWLSEEKHSPPTVAGAASVNRPDERLRIPFILVGY